MARKSATPVACKRDSRLAAKSECESTPESREPEPRPACLDPAIALRVRLLAT